jgi:hypothetical protein
MSAAEAAVDGAGGQAVQVREDQVQSAVQFLTHPKVQAASLEDRKKFLVKKGLTAAEIDEAIRVAQPQLDQQAIAAHPAGGAGGVASGGMGPSQPAPGVFADAPPSVTHAPPAVASPSPAYLAQQHRRQGPLAHLQQQQQPLMPAASPSNNWSKVVLASMAVAGVGGGLGLLARKALRGGGEPLASLFSGSGAGDRVSAAEVAAAAAEARREAAAAATSAATAMAEVTVKVDKLNGQVDTMTRAVEKMQASVEVNTRALERIDERLRALEAKPSLEACKAEILNSCHSAINQHAMTELKHDLAALRGAVLTLAANNSLTVNSSSLAGTPLKDPFSETHALNVSTLLASTSGDGEITKHVAAAAAAAAADDGTKHQPHDTSQKPPPGLPNARIFRKLKTAGSSGAAGGATRSSGAASASPAAAASFPSLAAGALDHGVSIMSGRDGGGEADPRAGQGGSGERGTGGEEAQLPKQLQQVLEANGVTLAAGSDSWREQGLAGDARGAGRDGERGDGGVGGERGEGGTEGSWMEKLRQEREQQRLAQQQAELRETETHTEARREREGHSNGSQPSAVCRGTAQEEVLEGMQHDTHVPPVSTQPPPYSTSFKEVRLTSTHAPKPQILTVPQRGASRLSESLNPQPYLVVRGLARAAFG